ncbi:ferredoxin [Robertkochia marina]|uniref:Ferredoxin n=1 Tax=Robertkochia marina TaxID=1227945 RepID=A0A4S3M641_9FLAO|nr:ferredoxin [Robertkochia marina]THD69687.1 ferredoxin [Robertkochia marina]TRZ46967.1 ferredoxin [Robertkochia marina]
MNEINNSNTDQILDCYTHSNVVVTREEEPAPQNEQLKSYRDQLHKYFVQGVKTDFCQNITVAPILSAPCLRGKLPAMHYPVLFDPEKSNCCSLHERLEVLISDHCNSDIGRSLIEKLPSILLTLQGKLQLADKELNYDSQVHELMEIMGNALGDDTPKNLQEHLDPINQKLLSCKGPIMVFSARTPYQLLNIHLKERVATYSEFIAHMRRKLSGLNEIADLQDKDREKDSTHFEFASDLLSLDALQNVVPQRVSSDLPKARLKRIRDSIKILSNAEKVYTENPTKIFITKQLLESYDLKEVFGQATLEVVESDAISHAKDYLKKELSNFVALIRAMRLAELEIAQTYDESLHDAYFEAFAPSYLNDGDIKYFPPVIVIDESRNIVDQTKDFISLFSDGAFIKVFAINTLNDINLPVVASEMEESSLEIASLAVFRRNAYVYQGSIEDPYAFENALRHGLNATAPVLWNVLLPDIGSEDGPGSLIRIHRAIESRQFPRLTYDIEAGVDFGSHFNLENNPQCDLLYPNQTLEIKNPGGKDTEQISLSSADYLAMETRNLQTLEIIPGWYQNEKLVPVADYLSDDPKTLIGKIPIIQVVDEDYKLHRAAIPASWLQRIRSRRDYWRFLQELGGVRSQHFENKLATSKAEWTKAKEAALKALEARLSEEYETRRAADIEKTIRDILFALMEGKTDLASLAVNSITPVPVSVKLETDEESVETVPAPKETHKEEVSVSKVPWVESDECTSCNDCINTAPNVFKYNSNKQAHVHNPKGDKYAKIVAAAEKCPAMCIHPGLPHDPNEPGLEKLLKRAEKYQ